MIRQFVLVNETVTDLFVLTDFCYVFESMDITDITGSCAVFGNQVGPFIVISSKIKKATNDYRLEDK